MTFAEMFPPEAGGKKIDRYSPEALASLNYTDELELKQCALDRLLDSKTTGGTAAAPLVPSPLPRGCRTTGKRRVSWREGRLYLHFGRIPGRDTVAESQLEPPEHARIYRTLHRLLSQSRNHAAAQKLNYCIVRGSYLEFALIFNVRELSAELIRSLRFVGEAAAKEIPSLRSVFLYVDESASDYYLEAERPEGKVAFKKLFGPEFLALKLEERKFLYPPTVFSQINESILAKFAAELSMLIAPKPTDSLLDLYCGYGLWSLLLADRIGSVWGAEMSREAIAAAKSNAQYHFPDKKMHFESGSITADFLRAKLPPAWYEDEIVLLDPPRRGCFPGVLETVIARKPRRIFHLFCGADEIAPALMQYRANGCAVASLHPFDFFPGTLNVELLAEIRPGAGTRSVAVGRGEKTTSPARSAKRKNA